MLRADEQIHGSNPQPEFLDPAGQTLGRLDTMDDDFAPNAADMPPEFADPEANAEELDPKFGIETSTASLRNLWSAWRCNEGSGRFGNPMIYGKSVGGVARPAVDAFLALEAALKATGYRANSRWSFNCRTIGKSTKYSLHSYGIAIDIDPRENPFTPGDSYSGKLKRQHVDAVLAIKNTRGQTIWSWGGKWKKPDRMHFQINRGPKDLEVDWATVRGGARGSVRTPDETTIVGLEVEEDNVLTRGASGAAVTHFQKRLMAWNSAALPKHQADGDYGEETIEWVKTYQTAAELEVTGNIDGVTAALLQGDKI